MATCQTGMGTVEWGILVGVWKAEDGIQMDGASVAEVGCTGDTDTDAAYNAGDVKEWGQVKSTLFLEAGTDVDALVGDTDTLTVTSPAGDTHVGEAFLVSAPLTSAKDDNVTRAATFRWTTAPTFTALP